MMKLLKLRISYCNCDDFNYLLLFVFFIVCCLCVLCEIFSLDRARRFFFKFDVIFDVMM